MVSNAERPVDGRHRQDTVRILFHADLAGELGRHGIRHRDVIDVVHVLVDGIAERARLNQLRPPHPVPREELAIPRGHKANFLVGQGRHGRPWIVDAAKGLVRTEHAGGIRRHARPVCPQRRAQLCILDPRRAEPISREEILRRNVGTLVRITLARIPAWIKQARRAIRKANLVMEAAAVRSLLGPDARLEVGHDGRHRVVLNRKSDGQFDVRCDARLRKGERRHGEEPDAYRLWHFRAPPVHQVTLVDLRVEIREPHHSIGGNVVIDLLVDLGAACLDPTVACAINEMQGLVATLADDLQEVFAFTQIINTAVCIHPVTEVHVLRSRPVIVLGRVLHVERHLARRSI